MSKLWQLWDKEASASSSARDGQKHRLEHKHTSLRTTSSSSSAKNSASATSCPVHSRVPPRTTRSRAPSSPKTAFASRTSENVRPPSTIMMMSAPPSPARRRGALSATAALTLPKTPPSPTVSLSDPSAADAAAPRPGRVRPSSFPRSTASTTRPTSPGGPHARVESTPTRPSTKSAASRSSSSAHDCTARATRCAAASAPSLVSARHRTSAQAASDAVWAVVFLS